MPDKSKWQLKRPYVVTHKPCGKDVDLPKGILYTGPQQVDDLLDKHEKECDA